LFFRIKIFLFQFYCQIDFLFRRFLCFLLESIEEYDQLPLVKTTERPTNVTLMLYSRFKKPFSSRNVSEKFARYVFRSSDYSKNMVYFILHLYALLTIKIQKITLVKNYCPPVIFHSTKLTKKLSKKTSFPSVGI